MKLKIHLAKEDLKDEWGELEEKLGWSAGAAWEDCKFDLKHFNHIERLAIVGETKWEKGMSVFCRPFMTASR